LKQIPKSDLLQLIQVLERDNRPYHFLWDGSTVQLDLDGITATLNMSDPPLSDLTNIQKPNRWIALIFAWLSLISFFLLVILK